MLAAQEMFRDANKVTKPEKALILGFMAGARGIILLYVYIIILLHDYMPSLEEVQY